MAEKGHPFPEASGSVVRPLRPDLVAATDARVLNEQHAQRTSNGHSEMQDAERGSAMLKDQFAEHKGKLAIGVAAMLGAAIFYKWRETQLARVEPEEYARLQRLKDKIRERELHLGRDADDDLLRGEDGPD